MDLAALRGCTLSALDTNADIRRQAELQLKQVLDHLDIATRESFLLLTRDLQAEATPGFIGALLDIIAADPEPQVRLSGIAPKLKPLPSPSVYPFLVV